jgi:hypothetical protein
VLVVTRTYGRLEYSRGVGGEKPTENGVGLGKGSERCAVVGDGDGFVNFLQYAIHKGPGLRARLSRLY